MGKVVFHIGYPKTGTTTLQKCFIDHPRVRYLGKMLRGAKGATDPRGEASFRLVMELLSDDSERFNAALPALRDLISGPLDDGLPVILSDEAFTMAEYMRLRAISATQVFTDHRVLADRLHQLWPEATVVVSIREQKSFLTSFYLQNLRTGTSFQSFPEHIDSALATSDCRSILNALRYDEMYEAYVARFGAANVKLMAFETYREDFSSLIATVAEAAGVDVVDAVARWDGGHSNERRRSPPHAATVHAMLSQSRWRPSEATYLRLSRMFSLLPDRIDVEPATAERLDAFFGPSNSSLEAATGISLAAFGYATDGQRSAGLQQ